MPVRKKKVIVRQIYRAVRREEGKMKVLKDRKTGGNHKGRGLNEGKEKCLRGGKSTCHDKERQTSLTVE